MSCCASQKTHIYLYHVTVGLGRGPGGDSEDERPGRNHAQNSASQARGELHDLRGPLGPPHGLD